MRTTPQLRGGIRNSTLSERDLAKKYNITLSKVRKWKYRDDATDGSNENTNGLLRQAMPKGTDLCMHSQTCLNFVAGLLSQRLRKALEFATPEEAMAEGGASGPRKNCSLDS